MSKLKTVFPSYLTDGGIFKALQDLEVPFLVGADPVTLNFQYLGNHSGNKSTSVVIDDILSGDTLTEAQITTLAEIMVSMYSESWKRLDVAFKLEYNAMDNVDDREETHDKTTKIGTGADTITSTLIHGLKDELSLGSTTTFTTTMGNKVTHDTTDENDVYAFNSSSEVPADKLKRTGTDTSVDSGGTVTAGSGKDTRQFSGSDVKTDVNALGTTTVTTYDHTHRRSGNIGVNTNQAQLLEEFSLWKNNQFMNYIFADIDKILTSSVYE